MAIDLAALKTEITTDPAALGYSGQQPGAQAALINGVGSSTTAVDRKFITSQEILKELKQADVESISLDANAPQHPAGQQNDYPGSGLSRLIRLQIIVTAASTGELDWTDQQVKVLIRSCFPATHMVTTSPTTRENIVALETIPATVATRAEELFGHTTVVTFEDITKALSLP